MATMGRTDATISNQGQDIQPQGGVGSPISNDAYNVLTALQSKLEGLEAYRKYQRDGSSEIWQRLSQSDQQAVSVLIDELERLVRDGKFRAGKQGGARQ